MLEMFCSRVSGYHSSSVKVKSFRGFPQVSQHGTHTVTQGRDAHRNKGTLSTYSLLDTSDLKSKEPVLDKEFLAELELQRLAEVKVWNSVLVAYSKVIPPQEIISESGLTVFNEEDP